VEVGAELAVVVLVVVVFGLAVAPVVVVVVFAVAPETVTVVAPEEKIEVEPQRGLIVVLENLIEGMGLDLDLTPRSSL
jgi:hypothetical protein